jgi:RNA 2',3'-cyclic 3'-phosphodiesterase
VRRLFVAADLDERTRSAIAELSARLAERLRRDPGVGRVGWIRADQLHLTLRFLGDIDEARVPAIRAAVGGLMTTPGFDLWFEGLGMFPPAGRPRVVWLGVNEGRANLAAVYREIELRLQAAAVPPEPRPFQAHLTLGRFRDPAVRPDLAAAGAGDVRLGPCSIDHVTLYESRLSGAGPTYAAVEQAMLQARP